jgi:hypothetical protein
MKPLRSWRNGDIRGHLRVRPRLRRRHALPPLPACGERGDRREGARLARRAGTDHRQGQVQSVANVEDDGRLWPGPPRTRRAWPHHAQGDARSGGVGPAAHLVAQGLVARMKPLRSWRDGDIRGHLRVRLRLRHRHALPPLPVPRTIVTATAVTP